MKTTIFYFRSVTFVVLLLINNVCYSQATINTPFTNYHPPYSIGKWEIQENGITTITCYIQRANVTETFRNNLVDIAEIAFTQGIEVWNTILQASNIPLRLNGIVTNDKESDAFNDNSTENIFAVSNKQIPDDQQPNNGLTYGFMYPITAKQELIVLGNQKFIKFKANHIELNHDAFEKGYLRIGVGDYGNIGDAPRQNICYVAAHEIGHFLGINRHFIGSNRGTFIHIANIAPPPELRDCDCENIVSKMSNFVSLEKDLMKGLYPALFLTTQHQNDDCIPQSTRPAPVKP